MGTLGGKGLMLDSQVAVAYITGNEQNHIHFIPYKSMQIVFLFQLLIKRQKENWNNICE